jgi:hypothetical protein
VGQLTFRYYFPSTTLTPSRTTPTKPVTITVMTALIAVLVWLGASERISVMALGLGIALDKGVVFRPDIIARLRLDAFDEEIVGLDRCAERNSRKIGVLAIAAWPMDEADDLTAHDRPSQTAIAIRPASAIDIRYAVMRYSLFRE